MLELAGHQIRAVSVGGLETCIELPQWKLCFDIGRCPPSAVRLPRVLFTHGHTDHMGGVIHHCATRDLLHMRAPDYWMPAECAEPFEALLAAWRRLDRSDLPCRVHPVRPGDRQPLDRDRWVQVFRAIHRVPTVGYVLGSQRKRLREDLRGAPREHILRCREAGEQVEVILDVAEVAFCGDTTIDVVDREEAVRKARLLILEVTFLDDRVSVEKARGKGHVHLDEVIERAHLFENEAILLTHVSARYSNAVMQRIVDERLPAVLRDRVTVLPHGAEWTTKHTVIR